ncbi:hypothetical protein [Massilia sp. Se16.2.3]|uniref:hypothetical protein n=1 Tax=Massilia sp. Se16.2.3 TaxID=2709303 RepID=UPI00280609C8|nr:hypothetical protein [Massilia sp. Se16.2.3]
MQLRLISTLKRARTTATPAVRAPRKSAAPTRPARPPRFTRARKSRSKAAPCRPTAAGCSSSPPPRARTRVRVGKMPRYVTESGYEEADDERTRVGRNNPAPEQLKLIDLGEGRSTTCPSTACPASPSIRWRSCARPPGRSP